MKLLEHSLTQAEGYINSKRTRGFQGEVLMANTDIAYVHTSQAKEFPLRIHSASVQVLAVKEAHLQSRALLIVP